MPTLTTVQYDGSDSNIKEELTDNGFTKSGTVSNTWTRQ